MELDGILTPESRCIGTGLSLKEPDDHFIELYCKGELVATWSSLGATPESIRQEAEKYI